MDRYEFTKKGMAFSIYWRNLMIQDLKRKCARLTEICREAEKGEREEEVESILSDIEEYKRQIIEYQGEIREMEDLIDSRIMDLIVIENSFGRKNKEIILK